jgi:uncharacterized repeat protein (TIGR03803 family)
VLEPFTRSRLGVSLRCCTGPDGDFYGSTPYGGVNDSDGTVFKVTRKGTLTILHSFAETDGRWPGDLVLANDGNFYGATAYGGANYSDGTIFMLTTAGEVTTLHSFDVTDGQNPGQLIQGTNGIFYGITGGGGDLNCDPSYGCGTAFSLDTGLGSFVATVPTIGRIGTSVIIIGTNLRGATGVSFNGTSTPFSIVSNTEITATVPFGATTGKVTVTSRKASFLSNTPFTVTK